MTLALKTAALAKHLRLALADPKVTPAAVKTIHAELLMGLLDQSKEMHDQLQRMSPFGRLPFEERLKKWLTVTDQAIEAFNQEVEERVYGKAS